METSKKRKRDVVEIPRITYDTATRIFDRLFKEDSLEGLKETVRKKLGVPSSTAIHLSQLRDGKAVDLEDDDDFEAFQAAAYSASVARVKVVVGNGQQPIGASGSAQAPARVEVAEPISAGRRKKKKKRRLSPSRAVTPTEDAPDFEDVPPSKKRRVSFAAPPSDLLSIQAANTSDKSSEPQDSAPPMEPAQNEASASNLATEAPEVLSEKKKRKKKKKDKSPEASTVVEPTQEDDEPVVEKSSEGKEKKKKSKKRVRSASPEPPADTASSEAVASTSTTTEAPTRPPKKVKKTAETSEAGQAPQETNSNQEPAPVAVAPEPPSESPSAPVKPKAKKEKKKTTPKDTEKVAEPPAPIDSSSPEKEAPAVESAPVDKKLKKKKSKANVDTAKTGEVPAEAAPTQDHGSTDAGKAKEKAPPSTPAAKKNASKAATVAPAPVTPAPAESLDEAMSQAQDISNAFAANILARIASKNGDGAPSKDSQAVSPVVERTPAEVPTPVAIEPSSSKDSNTTTTTSSSNAAPVAPSSQKPATETPAAKPAKLTAAQRRKAICPVCNQSPLHARNRCPLVKEGVRAIRKRVAELQKDNAEEHAVLIEELQVLIDKKTKKPRVSTVNGASHAEEHADAGKDNSATAKSPEKAAAPVEASKAVAPPATPQAPAQTGEASQPEPPSQEEDSPSPEPSRTPSPPPSTQPRPVVPKSPAAQSKPSASSPKKPAASSQKQQQQKTSVPKNSRSFDKDSSRLFDTSDISLASIGLPGGLLGFGAGDISAMTEDDIEALVRGPRPSLNSRNLASSDSSDYEDAEDDLEPDVVMEEEEEEQDEKAQRAARRLSKMVSRGDSSDEEVVAVGPGAEEEEEDDDDGDSTSPGDVTLQSQSRVIAASKVQVTGGASMSATEDIPDLPEPSPTSTAFDLRAGEHSFMEVDQRGTSQVLDTSTSDAVNDIISADIGAVPEPEVEEPTQDSSQESRAEPPKEAPQDDVVVEEVEAEEEPKSTEDAGDRDPIEVEPPQLTQGDPIDSAAEEEEEEESPAPAQSTPKARVAARLTRSQRAAAAQPSQPEPTPKTTRKSARTLTKISELPVPPHPNSSIRVIKPATVAVVARTTRSKAAVVPEPEPMNVDDEDEETRTPEPEPEQSIALTRGRRAGSVAPKTPAPKTPAKLTRATAKQALQTPATTAKPTAKSGAKPASKAASQTPAAKPPSKAAATKATRMTTRTKASQLTADLEQSDEEDEEQDTTINGHAPTQGGETGDESLAEWSVLRDKSSQADLTQGNSSPTQNMEDELVSSPRGASPADHQASQASQQAGTDGDEEAWQTRQDPLFLYGESQQSFPYSQYPDLVPKRSQDDSDEEEEEVESTILKPSMTQPRPSGPFRSLTEISSQSQREFFAPRYSSQLANIGKPAVQDMYGGLVGGDDDEDESGGDDDSDSDSEAERKANNSHIPQTRRAGVSSKRK